MRGSADLGAEFTVRHSLSTLESTLLSELSYREKKIFTINDVISALKVSYNNAKVITNRLVRKGWLIRLTSGKYMIVPLEAGVNGHYSEHGFVLASHLVSPYYIGYLSALNYHGLTDRVSPSIFIVTPKRRADRVILHTKLSFITISEKKMFGYETMLLSNTRINISDPEKTIVDCLDRPKLCGGIDEISKTLFFEHRSIDFPKLLIYAKRNGNNTVIKRLGYILETLELSGYLKLFSGIKLYDSYSKLDPTLPKDGSYNGKWRIIENTTITSKEWLY